MKTQFLIYLQNTLIPDYRSNESALAYDLEALESFIDGSERYGSFTPTSFRRYLKQTLIPDLKLGGEYNLASDFQKGLALLNKNKNVVLQKNNFCFTVGKTRSKT